MLFAEDSTAAGDKIADLIILLQLEVLFGMRYFAVS
jgi:hypothetical protein